MAKVSTAIADSARSAIQHRGANTARGVQQRGIALSARRVQEAATTSKSKWCPSSGSSRTVLSVCDTETSADVTNKMPVACSYGAGLALWTLLGQRADAATMIEPHNPIVTALADGSLSLDNLPLAIAGGGAIAALAAVLNATDPSKRRAEMADSAGGNEMESVKNYFNTTGFDRWKRIYGETDDVNKVQLDIREGHAVTVEKVLNWLKEDGGVTDVTIADCGCGTGSLAIPLALDGAIVNASDISSAMANEAQQRYETALKEAGKAGPSRAPQFEALDLESASGKYNTVTCLDVMIHYPQDKVDGMVTHLASLAEERLIISFAPKTLAYSLLKRVGELFPGPSKATRAYLHAEEDVEKILNTAGWKVTKREMTATSFYFSRLLYAERA